MRVADAAGDGPSDSDSDGDAIIDARDKCPQQAEDRDGYEDDDGCPEFDNDGDGIPDAQDRCPLLPETINGTQDDDGCPDGDGAEAPIDVNPEQSPVKAAEATFRRGRDLMTEKKYSAACATFEQSQRLDPQAGTQYNLALCYVEIGKLATAWNILRELVRTDKKAERRERSNELAAQLAPRVPKLKMNLVGRPAGVSVFMNGTNVNALIGIEAPIDFGTYTIVAGAPGHRGWRQTVEVKRDGEIVTVEIDLGPPMKP
ncbi:MAG TPA: thrombospondin type 3 repeat-containing protein [Kofleriaceae bacterium]|nr:thrombospondin type 3 repeat-containing protein [Kofleriaceae bacterium]